MAQTIKGDAPLASRSSDRDKDAHAEDVSTMGEEYIDDTPQPSVDASERRAEGGAPPPEDDDGAP